jgi:hypothetical protein
MIGVVVGEHQRIESPNAFARQGCPQRIRVGPGVDENRAPAVSDKHGIALPDIEHYETWCDRKGRTDSRPYQCGRHDCGHCPRVATRGRKRPPDPQSRGEQKSYTTQEATADLHPHCGAGQRGEALSDRRDDRERDRRELEHGHPETPGEEPGNPAEETHGQGDSDERHRDDVCQR